MEAYMKTKMAAAFLDKGGVGKTTAIAHLGVAMDQLGEEVLLIDLAGKQGDLAKHFGLWQDIQAEEDRWPNITTTFAEEWETIAKKLPNAVDDLVVETGEGPDLIPAHESLDGLDAQLGQIDDTHERYTRLEEFLEEYIYGSYDVVLVDLPGSTSNVAYNGLWAARHILAPVRPGPFEEGQAAQLRSDLETIHSEQDVDIEISMLMLNELDERTNAGQSFRNEFAAEYPDAIAPRQINSSQDVVNAQINGSTLFALDEPSTTAQRAREAYLENAEELLRRLE
jgi:chromosome partitioning protein